MQALLARQQAEEQEQDLHQMPHSNSPPSSAVTQALQARQRAEGHDEYNSMTGSHENPVNTSSAVILAMQARQRSEEAGYDDTDDPPSSVSNAMMQVLKARQAAAEEDRIQWVPAPQQNPAPSGSSALIQAMLARQQAQNEYDDGYWTKGRLDLATGTATDTQTKNNRMDFSKISLNRLLSTYDPLIYAEEQR